MSRRTGEAYVAWIRRCIVFHDNRHPAEMSAPEVTKFLTSLAANEQVAASTQNEALSTLLFLYGLEGYTHRDALHGVAAYPDSRRPRRANASGWIERPES